MACPQQNLSVSVKPGIQGLDFIFMSWIKKKWPVYLLWQNYSLQNCRITEWLTLEEASGGHLVQLQFMNKNGKGRPLIRLNKLLIFFKTWKMGPPTQSLISWPTSPSALNQNTILARAKNQLFTFVAVGKRVLAAETWEGGGSWVAELITSCSDI